MGWSRLPVEGHRPLIQQNAVFGSLCRIGPVALQWVKPIGSMRGQSVSGVLRKVSNPLAYGLRVSEDRRRGLSVAGWPIFHCLPPENRNTCQAGLVGQAAQEV